MEVGWDVKQKIRKLKSRKSNEVKQRYSLECCVCCVYKVR